MAFVIFFTHVMTNAIDKHFCHPIKNCIWFLLGMNLGQRIQSSVEVLVVLFNFGNALRKLMSLRVMEARPVLSSALLDRTHAVPLRGRKDMLYWNI